LEVQSEKDFSVSRKYTTKILNRYSRNERMVFIHHDQFSKVAGAKVELLDANFQRIEKYSLSDFNDVSISSGVASDSRAMILELRYNQYPYYVQVYTGPSAFEIDGYAGDMTSWKSFGNWINALNADKNNLNAAQKAEIAAIVKPIESDLEK
ncbi:hypothetical protein B484DRAFT_440979, partial [Ochromonadaceae sp. CCMP2298]